MRYSYRHPRYKICFQTKNKVWIYKNSRLRNFYKIRGKRVVPTGRHYRRFLITKNMKWTVARRQMVPYPRRKNKFFFIYKNLFFKKQQLKNFYGGLKEFQIRNIFKNYWNKQHWFKRSVFIGALEQRLSVFLFRMKLLPTIFACNQLVRHHGILVNNQNVTSISHKISLGDIVSIPEDKWFMFYLHLYEKIFNRYFGNLLFMWRRRLFFRKIQYCHMKKRRFFGFHWQFVERFRAVKQKIIKLKHLFYHLYKILKNEPLLKKKVQYMYIMFYKFLKVKNRAYIKRFAIIKRWKHKKYFQLIKNLYRKVYNLQGRIVFIYLFLAKFWISFLKKKYSKNLKLSKAHKIKYFSLSLSNKLFFYVYKKYIRRIIAKKVERFWQVLNSHKSHVLKFKRYYFFFKRKLKYRKKRLKIFKNFCFKVHWYIPKYIEMDFTTLRASFIYYPESKEVHFGFLCSFSKIISFYKEKAL